MRKKARPNNQTFTMCAQMVPKTTRNRCFISSFGIKVESSLRIESVSEGINEVIDAELICGIRVLRRVPLVVRVFPAIPHI